MSPRFISWDGRGGKTPYRFPPLFVWDFTQQSPGALVLPSELELTRASSGHSVRTGTSTVLTTGGFTSNDVGRIGRVLDAHNYGLLVEPARTNLYPRARSANLAAGTAGAACTYTTGRTGPDSTTNAVRGQTASGAYSRYEAIGPITGSHTLSAWAAQGLGSGAYQVVGAYSGTTGAAVGGTASAAWSRVEAVFSYPAASTAYVNPWDGRANGTLGSAAGARDCDLDLIQFEAGKYPTSAIITSGGATATRAGERPRIGGVTAVASTIGGRIGVYLRFRALAASSELAAIEGYLLAWAGGAVFIDGTNKYIYAYDGSPDSQTANNAISWSRYDLLEFVIEVGAGLTVLRWRVNGGSVNTANFSVQNDVFGALDLSAGVDVCNVLALAQMPSCNEVWSTHVPGYGPF